MRYNQFKILLSASVPSEKRNERYQEKYTKIKHAQIQIEEAVIGLSRNIFQQGGQLIFGGHPSISPLIAMVATEFKLNLEIENMERNEIKDKPILLFQSRAFEDVSLSEKENLLKLGYTQIKWIDAVGNEKYDPEIEGEPQCEKSLELMRQEMINQPIDALVCIGGMENVEREFELFREIHSQKPIFLLKTTGGACKILAEKHSNNEHIRVIDADFNSYIQEVSNEVLPPKFEIIPYAFITSHIVKEVIS